MEGGLCEPTLAEMKISLAREQTVAEEWARTLERAPFDEESLIGDEDIADHVRMLQIDYATPEWRKSKDIAKGLGVAAEESEEIALRLQEERTWEARARPWWEVRRGHGVDVGALR
jgi:hypothetical protein